MDKTGVLIEMRDGKLKPSNLAVCSAASRGDGECIALLLDDNESAVGATLQDYGVDSVVKIEADDRAIPWNPEAWTAAIMQAMAHYGIATLLGLASVKGKILLAGVAAALDAPLVMDCTAVDLDRHAAVKPQFSGKALAEFVTHGERHIYGLRPNALPAVKAPRQSRVETFQATIGSSRTTVLNVRKGASDRVDLTEANVIISGGRGMANGDNFGILHECARPLSAAVGASRVAVDAGWVSHTMQVGQTGKTVTPKVYIACGISGSVQHFAGMKTAGLIIAVNTDPQAAIMQKCDYAVCADLFDIIPALTRKLQKTAD
ncbi:MAG: electron transfer flavoprotein subunit alpha/FixB family protein [Deltaproteobacteria bacterium]|nr:electron transfer flavoprotein subunit alpha/FixB family protein [Deltaproteobacteria bacterium]